MTPAPFYTLTAGDLTVTAVSDGQMSAPLSLLSGITPEEAERLQRNAGLASPEAIAIGAYLIRGRGHTVLVDTGTGGVNGVGGALIATLALLGVRPEEIDTILLTHAHPDHIGGLLTATGAPAYPNATVFLPTRESAYWLNPHWTTPAIAAGATCCSSTAYWQSARRKFAKLMVRRRSPGSTRALCPAIRPAIPGIVSRRAIPRCSSGGILSISRPFRPPGRRCRSPSTSILNRPDKPGNVCCARPPANNG